MRPNNWSKRPQYVVEGSFAAVIKAYLASPIYAEKAEGTKKNYRQFLTMAENPEALGGLSVLTIRPSLVQAFLDGLAGVPGRQKNARTALKAVEKFALVRDLLPNPIMTGTECVKTGGGHAPWPDAMVQLALEKARPDLARVVMLAVETGQRGSDIIKMRWSDIEEQRDPVTGQRHPGIHVIQRKTKLRLWVPFTRAMAEAIEEWRPTRRPPFHLVLREDGTPFPVGSLSTTWNRERDYNQALRPLMQARLVLHGLRSTAVVRARQSGLSALQISNVFGMSEPMAARYSRLADQRDMAIAAVHRLDISRTPREHSRGKDLKMGS